MSKCDLIKRLRQITRRPEADIREVVNLFLREVERAIITGQCVDIRDFGSFVVVKRKGRPSCRNPKKPTELHPKPPYIDVRFSVGKALKITLQRLLPGEPENSIGHNHANRLSHGA